MQGLVLRSRLLQTSSDGSACRLLGPLRHMCMRRISKELAAEDDSHDYRISNVSKVRASGASMQVDQDLRMRDEIDMFRPQRKNPLVTLTNVALVAVAAGIATALGRELQEERSLQKSAGPNSRLACGDGEGSYPTQPHPLKIKLDYVMLCQHELETEFRSLEAQPSTRSTARRRKEIVQEQTALDTQKAHLMEDARQLLLHREA